MSREHVPVCWEPELYVIDEAECRALVLDVEIVLRLGDDCWGKVVRLQVFDNTDQLLHGLSLGCRVLAPTAFLWVVGPWWHVVGRVVQLLSCKPKQLAPLTETEYSFGQCTDEWRDLEHPQSNCL